MKLVIIAIAFFATSATPLVWLSNIEQAKTVASTENKLILVNFAGSDWCIPCIRMEKQVFETAAFSDYAAKNLVLVKADFPRLKKNLLSKEQTALNESLAGVYNPHGKFPYTLLLDKTGKVLKEWDGLPTTDPATFVNNVNAVVHAGN